MEDILYSLIVIGIALVIAFVIFCFVKKLLKGRLSKIKIKGREFETRKLLKPFCLFIPTVCLFLTHPSLRLNELYLGYYLSIIKMCFIASLGWFAISGVHFFCLLLLNRYDVSAQDNLRARKVYTQVKVLENVVNAIIIIITFALILMSFTKAREIGMSVMASAGVLGIVIGFAAQKTLGNLIAGIQLAITQPVRLDDVVIIEGEWGWIEEINLTFVVVRIWDLRRMVVPLSYFMEKPFQNWTRTSADLLGTVFMYVDYTIPVEEIRNELTRILTDHPLWDKKVNVIHVTNMNERTVELRALMSAKNSPNAWELRCNVREKLLNYLQENHPNSLPKVRLDMKNIES